MTKLYRLIVVLSLTATCHTAAQSNKDLRDQIFKIVSGKKAFVGVSIAGNNGNDTFSLNGGAHLPLQSVFKFHIALAMLAQVDKGKFTLNQRVQFEKKSLLPNLYSPIREKYPNGVTLSIAKIIEYAVAQSDNAACDVLLELLGGAAAVEAYIKKNGIAAISIKINEAVQQSNWELQFQNWTTPRAATELLLKYYHNTNQLLSKKSYDFIWKIMKATQTGKARLKGGVPRQTAVAHKTGTSGTNKKGITAAVNDIGVVFLPGGNYFFISVFVTNSAESETVNEKIIADIAGAAWAHFTGTARLRQ